MKYIEYSHRFAKPIIEADPVLLMRYNEFIDTLSSITDQELINDFVARRNSHISSGTAFKSLTHSINSILKHKMLQIPDWQAEVDIFNDTDTIGNTEWRLDFACNDGFCIEVAFNHGEAIAWNLLKPVLSCELNHVQKAVQGKVGIYVCATEKMKVSANIDSASGSYEKVLRYLQPMMNQLTVPMMIIGLEPFDTFKISTDKEVVQHIQNFDVSLCGKKAHITLNDFSVIKGKIVQYIASNQSNNCSPYIELQTRRNAPLKTVKIDEIRFIEPQNS